MVSNGANNLVQCVHCGDLVGDLPGSIAKLLKDIMCFYSKIFDFVCVCYGQSTAVISLRCSGGGWGLRWINIDERVRGMGAADNRVANGMRDGVGRQYLRYCRCLSTSGGIDS
uniref:Uncharacterized protein n=1 Tax=Romanomermis culicivorax TaxID=13658 RepID=A0A915IYC0_ROMCU